MDREEIEPGIPVFPGSHNLSLETNLIFLSNVGKFFNGQPLFKDANISVHRSDRIGMVGPNGAGKSTILGIMEGVVTPDEGEVSIEKKVRMGVLHQELIQGNDRPILDEVTDCSPKLREIRESLFSLEEEMETLSENSKDLESILHRHGRLQNEFESYGGYSLEAKALKVLGGLGFQPDDAHRRWSQFSGGWRMRVALAGILVAEPDALLLDEPTNHLDLESLLWVEEYLTGFKGALVLISHDRAFLNRLVTKIIEVERGKVTVYKGNYDEYEKNKAMQEEVVLAAYKNQQEKRKRIQKFIDQNRVKARTASRVQSRVKMMEKMEHVEPPPRARMVSFSFPQPSRSGKRVVEINDLVKRYDQRTVYDGFNVVIERGDRIALVGPNGAGKSTLLKIVGGVLPYEGGTVKYGHGVKPGYFAQHQSEHLSGDRTVLEEAALPVEGIAESEVRSLLGAFLFSGDDVFKKVGVLSGGEKSRLALAKILLAPPNLLLMDEPTNHLDIPSCRILEEGLKKFEGTLVLITHDRRLMNEICTGILEIRNGVTEYYLGNYEEYEHKKRLTDGNTVGTVQSEPLPPPKKDTPTPGRDDRKNRKRKEAETRKSLSRRRAPILDEIRRIEATLESRESRRNEMQVLMADPKNYESKDLILPLLEEERALAKEIKTLESRWESLQTQLGEIEERATSQQSPSGPQ